MTDGKREKYEMIMQSYRDLAIWRLKRSTGPLIKVTRDGNLSFEDSEDQRNIMAQYDQAADDVWDRLSSWPPEDSRP